MKRQILIVLFAMISSLALGQQYEFVVKVSLMSPNNNVKCGSYFKIVFKTVGNKTWEWYQGFNASEDQWKTWTKTFSADPGDRIKEITTISHRYTENAFDCKHQDGGSKTTTIDGTFYVCSNMAAMTGKFPGYTSKLEIDVKPLSSVFAVQTEAKVVVNKNDILTLGYSVDLKYSNGQTENVFSAANPDVNNGAIILNRQTKIKTNKNVRVTHILVNTQYTIFDFSNFNFIDFNQTKSFPVNDKPKVPLDTTLNGPFASLSPTSSLRVRFALEETPVNQTDASNILPSENNTTLSIPEVYSGYRWQYNIENTGWINAPASFGANNSVTFTGQSLLGAVYRNYLFKNIAVRALYTCASPRATEAIVLRHLPSSPSIASINGIQETCNGLNDAKVKLSFNRPLYSNETLYIFANGETENSVAQVMDSANAVTLYDFSPGAYNFSLVSLFDGDPGYSDDPSHRATKTIVARPPITNFSAITSDVHCFDGEDGKITVSAQGGTGTYTSSLLSVVDTTQLSLTSVAPNSFNDLGAGTYNVKLKDTNGCDPKDGSNNVIILPRFINQPAQGVTLSTVENIEPLGFGLQNGRVTVRAEYATLPFTFSWTDSIGSTLTADASVTEDVSMISTLSNIGRGTYHVIARDDNFYSASPPTEVNIRGCYDTLSLEVTEPSLLEVAVTDRHYVTCYSYKDGELIAHAKGGRPYLFGDANHPYIYAWFIRQDTSLVAFGSSDSLVVDRPSAIYRIKVTDRNGIVAWSPDFTLVQPDPLLINFNTSQLLCNGDTNGTSEALPEGGTLPYQFTWSTEDTTNSIQNLSDGWYSVVVKDIRGCTTFDQTEVTAPNGLEADAEVIVPTCFGYSDGSIQLVTNGGISPYTYAWQHGDTTDFTQNLANGNYRVIITDGNNCFIIRDYELVQPDLLSVNLGPDRVLCKDQSFAFNATISDPQATYTWLINSNPFASTPTVQLIDAGTYHLEVTDSSGCTNSDEITIARTDIEISSDFAVATRVPKGERVYVANISYPAPDRMEWILPQEAFVLNEQENFVELQFSALGEYTLGLRSFKGACEATSFKTVQVVNKSELSDYATPSEPYIKQFIVSPNPNNGIFSATIELREPTNFTLILYSSHGNVIAQREIRSQLYTRQDFDLTSVGSGAYLLQLVTAGGVSTLRLLIQ